MLVDFFLLFHSLSTAALASGAFIASPMTMGSCTGPSWKSDTYPFSEMWSMCFCVFCSSILALLLTFIASGFPEHPSLETHGIEETMRFLVFARASEMNRRYSVHSDEASKKQVFSACVLQFCLFFSSPKLATSSFFFLRKSGPFWGPHRLTSCSILDLVGLTHLHHSGCWTLICFYSGVPSQSSESKARLLCIQVSLSVCSAALSMLVLVCLVTSSYFNGTGDVASSREVQV